jgi:hypothetical protein
LVFGFAFTAVVVFFAVRAFEAFAVNDLAALPFTVVERDLAATALGLVFGFAAAAFGLVFAFAVIFLAVEDFAVVFLAFVVFAAVVFFFAELLGAAVFFAFELVDVLAFILAAGFLVEAFFAFEEAEVFLTLLLLLELLARDAVDFFLTGIADYFLQLCFGFLQSEFFGFLFNKSLADFIPTCDARICDNG